MAHPIEIEINELIARSNKIGAGELIGPKADLYASMARQYEVIAADAARLVAKYQHVDRSAHRASLKIALCARSYVRELDARALLVEAEQAERRGQLH